MTGPHFPRERRFYSGGARETYNLKGRYNFTWLANSIQWSADLDKSTETYEYTTSMAQTLCATDMIPCVTPLTEVRINIWNVPDWSFTREERLRGGPVLPFYDYGQADRTPDFSFLETTTTTTNTTDTNNTTRGDFRHYRVAVVVDHFSFVPAAHQQVPNGGACSKSCQCGTGSLCSEGICVPTRSE